MQFDVFHRCICLFLEDRPQCEQAFVSGVGEVFSDRSLVPNKKRNSHLHDAFNRVLGPDGISGNLDEVLRYLRSAKDEAVSTTTKRPGRIQNAAALAYISLINKDYLGLRVRLGRKALPGEQGLIGIYTTYRKVAARDLGLPLQPDLRSAELNLTCSPEIPRFSVSSVQGLVLS